MRNIDISTQPVEFRYRLVKHLFSERTAEPDAPAASRKSVGMSSVGAMKPSLKKGVDIREDQFLILNCLMVEMMTHRELDPLLQHIAEIMIEHTVAKNALILLVDETKEFIQVVASAGSHSHKYIGERRHRGVGLAGLAWEAGTTQYIADSDTTDLTRGFWPSGTQLLAEPLLVDGHVIGVAVLGAPSLSGDFSVSSGLVNSLASLAGIAIANAQSQEQSRAEVKRMRALSNISKQLMSFDTLEELLTSVTRALVDAMDINRSSGHRVHGVDQLVAEAGWLKTDDDVIPFISLSDDLLMESIGGWCFRTGEYASVLRNERDPRVSTRIHELRDELNTGATLCMPISSGQRVVGLLTVSRDRERRDFDENEIYLFFSIVNQVSSAFVAKEMSNALHHQVNHDSLTQLPNRRCFENELEQELAQGGVSDVALFAVLFLDLDGFKLVNDTMGHACGDKLLQLVASRLSATLGKDHLLARIGGDEFAVIARKLTDRQQAISMSFRLRESLQQPFLIDESEVIIGTSIGISFYPSDSASADELLRYADEAMYQAKALGDPGIVCFHESMALATKVRCEIESELREAIIRQEFELYFQPQVNVEQGCVESVEALIRWNHRKRGVVSPSYFISVAEESGLINTLGAWVLDETIRQLAAWRGTSLQHLRVGVNIAAPQFLEEDFCSSLLRSLARANVSATLLEIEVTESIVMKDVKTVIKRLNRLRDAGMRVAVDDFGTGYSSLSYLQDLPLDVLKIDRAFISCKEGEKIDYSLVNTIVLMAQGLGLDTVAEGVESESQLSQLVELGCTLIQGYLFAKPCRASELQEIIDAIQARLDAQSLPGKGGLRIVGG
ncbi:MAG: EAL domain-containing protein [Granulosicoccus sp.]